MVGMNKEEDNESENREKLVLHEEEKGKHFWYWILALLAIILLGWYGYSAGWFQSWMSQKGEGDVSQVEVNLSEKAERVPENLAQIAEVRIQTSNTFPVKKTLVVKALLPDSCTYLDDPQVIRDGNTFYVDVKTRREENAACAEAIRDEEIAIPLEVLGLPAGKYMLVVNGKELSFELEQDNRIEVPVEEQK